MTPIPTARFQKIITVSGGTLFDVAAAELGDATQWNRIARLNGLIDPFLDGMTTLRIPAAGTSNGGIL